MSETLPSLPEPHYLMRTRPVDGEPHEFEFGPSYDRHTVTPEWQAYPQREVDEWAGVGFAQEYGEGRTDLGSKLRREAREFFGREDIEVKFVSPNADDAAAERAKRVGGDEAKQLKTATAAADKAAAALTERIDLIDAAREALAEAGRVAEKAEMDFARGEVEWPAVTRATEAKEQAAARLRFAERGVGELEDAFEAATVERLRAQYRVATRLLDEENVAKDIRAALAPLAKAWATALAALAAAGEVVERYRSDDEEAVALAQQIERMAPQALASEPAVSARWFNLSHIRAQLDAVMPEGTEVPLELVKQASGVHR